MTKLETNAAQAANEPEAPKSAAAAAPELKAETPAAEPMTLTQDQLNQIIAAAVQSTRTEVMGDMVKLFASQKAEGTGAGDTSALISDLAMAIASMSDQGNNRRTVPPAEAKRREDAMHRMGAILIRIEHDPNLRPHYQVVSQTWLEGTLIEPWVPDGDTRWKPAEIIWRGAPNAALRPMNDIAKELCAEYLQSIGGTTKNMAGVRDQPTWVGNGGLQIIGQGSATAAARGQVREPPEPMTIGADLATSNELTSSDNPNADKIRILGSTMAPAERTARGKTPSLQFPHSQ